MSCLAPLWGMPSAPSLTAEGQRGSLLVLGPEESPRLPEVGLAERSSRRRTARRPTPLGDTGQKRPVASPWRYYLRACAALLLSPAAWERSKRNQPCAGAEATLRSTGLSWRLLLPHFRVCVCVVCSLELWMYAAETHKWFIRLTTKSLSFIEVDFELLLG